MRPAIIIPYFEDQNEPSQPLRQLVLVPDDIEGCETLLRDIWKTVFLGVGKDADTLQDHGLESDKEIVVTRDNLEYGDFQASWGPEHIFITFLDDCQLIVNPV